MSVSKKERTVGKLLDCGMVIGEVFKVLRVLVCVVVAVVPVVVVVRVVAAILVILGDRLKVSGFPGLKMRVLRVIDFGVGGGIGLGIMC